MADIEVPHPGASEIVGRLLSEALSEHPDVQWLGLVSEDGFAIASDGAYNVDDDAVAAGAVRMMIQVRSMAKALGQSGTSQLFLEGSESGICVIDKDPWVLVLVGAPGVPIGLLRFEAREIADAFPMSGRAALPAGLPSDSPEPAPPGEDVLADEDAQQWWTTDQTQPEPQTRWADEPTRDDHFGVQESQERPAPDGFDLPPLGAARFDLAPPVEDEPAVAARFAMADLGNGDLSDLAAPTGPSIDLPPPLGPAFQLPPPQ